MHQEVARADPGGQTVQQGAKTHDDHRQGYEIPQRRVRQTDAFAGNNDIDQQHQCHQHMLYTHCQNRG